MQTKLQASTVVNDHALLYRGISLENIKASLAGSLAREIEKSGKLDNIIVRKETPYFSSTQFTATVHVFTDSELEEYVKRKFYESGL